jgi:diguanylate cyclase (GGDEF)-like protein
MGLLAFLLSVIVLNLCLGYGVAMFLDFAPPTLGDAWNALWNDPAEVTVVSDEAAAALARELGNEFASVGADLELAAHDAQQELSLDTQAFDYSFREQDIQYTDPDSPENWNLNEKFIETSVLKLNIAMMKSGMRCTEIDTELRGARGRTDSETIQRSLALLKEDCETYLVEQSEAATKFSSRIGELGELRSLGEEIEMTNMQQASQIETTLSNLANMDFTSDLEAANARLLTELKSLRLARHMLRDNQEAAFLAIARYENRLDKIESRLFNDPLTGIPNRIGLEVTLNDWWVHKKHASKPITASLYDVDEFGALNDAHGPKIGDGVLRHAAKFIGGKLSHADLLARYAGQRLIVFQLGAGGKMAIKNAELIRQSFEGFVCMHETKEIRLTLTAAITEITPQDTYEGVFRRLEATLAAARSQGRNRTFIHNGREAAPLQAPPMKIEQIAVSI